MRSLKLCLPILIDVCHKHTWTATEYRQLPVPSVSMSDELVSDGTRAGLSSKQYTGFYFTF